MNDNNWIFEEPGNYGEMILDGVKEGYTWTTSNGDVAYVDEDGELIIEGEGEATITITGPNGGKASFVVKFDDGVPNQNESTETPSTGENKDPEQPNNSDTDEDTSDDDTTGEDEGTEETDPAPAPQTLSEETPPSEETPSDPTETPTEE